DAIKLRNRIIDCVEKSTTVEDSVERKRLLNFVIVGAGATGVELAAEIADWFFDTFKKFYKHKINCSDISIHLSTDGTHVLPQFHPSLRARSAYILKKKGVQLHFAARAVQIKEKRVIFADGSDIETDTVIWAAGVTPENLPADVEFARDSRKRIIVNASLQVENHPEIFALGDIASFTQAVVQTDAQFGQPLPMLAQVAVSEAEIVAQNVARSVRNLRRNLRDLRALPLAKFKYRRRGDLVSLGTWQAVADIFGTRWSGPLAWFIWRTVYLMKFSSWSKKIRIAVDWTIDIFYPRDITKA
ncbi:MAG: FAD-dependent oxidoreductase, partial [Patescibacteria group bacterium]